MTPSGEEFRTGHLRRIAEGRVLICHRLTAKDAQPELWSLWEVWADFPDDETARKAHDWSCAHGPWRNPYMPPNL